MNALEFRAVSIAFGGIKAVQQLSFAVEQGESFGIIGPNGAGKSTVLNLASGIYQPDSGQISLFGEESTRWPLHAFARRGLARTFQNNRLFSRLSVLEHLFVAQDASPSPPRDRHSQALELLSRLRLSDVVHRLPGELPYGSRKRLEVARALATGAKLLLLDEPAAGLNHAETDELRSLLRELKRERGLTIIAIEHDLPFILGLCERILVMDQGSRIALGSPAEVRADPRVVQSYLGVEA